MRRDRRDLLLLGVDFKVWKGLSVKSITISEKYREFWTGNIMGHAEGRGGHGHRRPGRYRSEASTVGGGRRPIDPLRWWALKRPPHYEADDPLDTHTNSHYHTSHRHTNRCHGPGTPSEPARGPSRPECTRPLPHSPPGTSPAAAASINSPAPVITPRGAVAPVHTPLAEPRVQARTRGSTLTYGDISRACDNELLHPGGYY